MGLCREKNVKNAGESAAVNMAVPFHLRIWNKRLSGQDLQYRSRGWTKCHTFIGVDAMGECIALTSEGCGLNEEQRPKGGRFLKSSPDGHCMQHYTQEMMENDWRPYQKVLSAIWQKYETLFQNDGTFDRCEEAWFAFMRSERAGEGSR